jgi:hypothetical protein
MSIFGDVTCIDTDLYFIGVSTCDITRPTLVLVLTVSDGWCHSPDSGIILQCQAL